MKSINKLDFYLILIAMTAGGFLMFEAMRIAQTAH